MNYFSQSFFICSESFKTQYIETVGRERLSISTKLCMYNFSNKASRSRVKGIPNSYLSSMCMCVASLFILCMCYIYMIVKVKQLLLNYVAFFNMKLHFLRSCIASHAFVIFNLFFRSRVPFFFEVHLGKNRFITYIIIIIYNIIYAVITTSINSYRFK